jgi:hypothetical protein
MAQVDRLFIKSAERKLEDAKDLYRVTKDLTGIEGVRKPWFFEGKAYLPVIRGSLFFELVDWDIFSQNWEIAKEDGGSIVYKTKEVVSRFVLQQISRKENRFLSKRFENKQGVFSVKSASVESLVQARYERLNKHLGDKDCEDLVRERLPEVFGKSSLSLNQMEEQALISDEVLEDIEDIFQECEAVFKGNNNAGEGGFISDLETGPEYQTTDTNRICGEWRLKSALESGRYANIEVIDREYYRQYLREE